MHEKTKGSARNSSNCKVLKYAEEDSKREYAEEDDDVVGWQSSQGGSQRELKVAAARDSAEHGASGQSIPPLTEPRRSMRARTFTWKTFTKTLRHTKISRGRCSVQVSYPHEI